MRAKALVIDLDVGQTSLTVPGMLAVGEVAQGGIDAAYGINASKANVFALPFGHANPGSNPRRYDQCVSLLADVAKKRIADNDGNRRGGILVNTCGWVDGEGLELLKTSIRTLSIDVVIVMGDDRLHSTLVRARDVGSAFDKSTTISKVTRSGGVSQRTAARRRAARSAAVRSYFYGTTGRELSPSQTVVKFADVEIVEIVGADDDDAILPVGVESSLEPVRAWSRYRLQSVSSGAC